MRAGHFLCVVLIAGCVVPPLSADGKRCTMTDRCPEGFECLAANATSGACWPKETGGSCLGCASTGPGAAAQAGLIFLGMLVVLRRRRRR